MKHVVVKLVFDTFEYVMQYYYPAGRRKWRCIYTKGYTDTLFC